MKEAISIIGALTSLFVIYKLVVDVVLAKSTRRRDEYSFTKNYIFDLKGGEEHPYTLEKGCFALTGKVYSIAEIKFLLSQPSPSFILNLRRHCSDFISFDDDLNIYKWSARYSNKIIRKYAESCFLVLYVVTASLAMLPLYFTGISGLSHFPTAVFSSSLLIAAVLCVVQQSNLHTTKMFMKNVVLPAPNKLS